MGLVSIVLVLLAGATINNENASPKVKDWRGFKHSVELTVEQRKPYNSGSLKNSATGNFGND